ncbi:hypothetical protein [Ornithinibacillus xuwenensis]|uniref:Uncharacterized protein n=1 Tax=Ornithinibacillus xuwenensis TaxID=3144668 RepID=A0ABU9XF95_9BACI
MTMKKKLFTSGIVLAVMLLLFLVYWYYLAKPGSLPTNEELIAEINEIYPQARADVIQDTISIDEKHVLVPFVSTNEEYGLSYLVWEKHKWKVVNIDTKGYPMLWKIEKNNPDSYYLVWNIQPSDQLQYIDFYMTRDRGFRISYGTEHYYYPKVQMVQRVNAQEKTYGAMALPDEWQSFMSSLMKVEEASQPQSLFYEMPIGQSIRIGFIPYDKNDKITELEGSINGSSYTIGDIQLDFVLHLYEEDLE